MSRWSREDWLAFGEVRLKAEGPGGLGLDALCTAAERTRGSFYHHFRSTEAFVDALVGRWRARTTDGIGEAALSARTPELASKTLMRLTGGIDPRTDLAIRALGASRPSVASAVAEIDETREGIVAALLRSAYGLDEARAGAGSRLFHSVYLAAQMRRPDDLRGFTSDAYRLLFDLLANSARPA